MSVDWPSLIELTVPPLELIARGSMVYLFLFIVFRTILQRDIGSVGVADILVIVLVADAAQNTMTSEYRSVSDGLILMSTLLGWNVLFDYLAFRFPSLRRLLQSPALCLIRDGQILKRNLRREFMSEEELLAKLREHEITNPADVRLAYMESDGTISVIKRSNLKKAKQG